MGKKGKKVILVIQAKSILIPYHPFLSCLSFSPSLYLSLPPPLFLLPSLTLSLSLSLSFSPYLSLGLNLSLSQSLSFSLFLYAKFLLTNTKNKKYNSSFEIIY